jgi:HEAT repeat protein
MKLELFQTRPLLSLSARAFFVVVLSSLLLAGADDSSKQRAKVVRDLAKQGSEAIPQIAGYLSDPDVGVRQEAVKSIVQIGTQRSLDPLVKALSDNDPEIQIRATDGLVNFYLPGYIQTGVTAPFKRMTTAVKGKFTDTNDQVIDAYIQVRPEVIEALGKVARGGASIESRAHAARALGILRGRAAIPDLLEAVRSKDGDVIYEALVALGKIHDLSVGPEIALRLKDPVEKVQIAAIETTGVLGNTAAANQVRDVFDRSKNAKVRKAALTTLAMLAIPDMHGVFVYRFNDKDEAIRVASAEGLGRLKDQRDATILQKCFTDEKKMPVRLACAFALVNLGQRDLTEFTPFRYLVNQLNSEGYRDVARSYLIEVTRDPATRAALYQAFDQSPSKDEKTGLCQVLGATGDRASIPYLEKLTKDTDDAVSKEAFRALENVKSRNG